MKTRTSTTVPLTPGGNATDSAPTEDCSAPKGAPKTKKAPAKAKAGAKGFFSKGVPLTTLAAAVRAVADGQILIDLGYKVKVAQSGEKAVEILKDTPVDLVVLDMIMDPGINGRETYERILKIHPAQKAIIVSGFAETDEVKETQKLGAGKYVKKPYTLNKLGIAVKEELKK